MIQPTVPAVVAAILEEIAGFHEIRRYHWITCLLRDCARLLRKFANQYNRLPVAGIISQGEKMPLTGTITGLIPGGSDQFFCTPVDVNGNADQLPTGSPVFTASDPGVTIGPPTVADPTGNSCTVTAPTTATPGSTFVLTWTAQFTPSGASAPTTITSTATVPYLAPPALNPVGGVISQTSPATAVSAAIKK